MDITKKIEGLAVQAVEKKDWRFFDGHQKPDPPREFHATLVVFLKDREKVYTESEVQARIEELEKGYNSVRLGLLAALRILDEECDYRPDDDKAGEYASIKALLTPNTGTDGNQE